MENFKNLQRNPAGFSLMELMAVIAGVAIITVAAVPALNRMMDQYRLTLAAQGMVSQLQYARMKAVASNESFQVHFVEGQNFYHVETETHTVMAGDFYLPHGISWNTTDTANPVTFPSDHVMFLATGNVPATGNGSAGRVKIINQAGTRIDIVVSNGGIIRQTTPYTGATPPF